MNATALPAFLLEDPIAVSGPAPSSGRAARIISAWLAWRTARLTRPRLDIAVDAALFGSLLATWVIGYALVCPLEPARHHVRPAVAAAATFVVLR